MTEKIVFVNGAGRVSGAEFVLLRLISVAVARGYRVSLVAPSGVLADRCPPEVHHVPIEELDLGGHTGLQRVLALGEIVRRWQRTAATIRRTAGSDGVVIVNSLLALPAARWARIPSGVSWLVHDTVSESKQRLLVRFSRKVVQRAVAVSPPTADAVRFLGVPIVVAPLGVDILRTRDCRTQPTTPVVGIMGALVPWKGHRVLLEALAKVTDVRCEIAGSALYADQSYVDELHRIAAKPALAGRVSFLGHVQPIATIRDWDVLVSASTSPEAGPIVALEAMSLGVPVIGTDHGGCAWLLRDGAGVLVTPGDANDLAAAIEAIVTRPADVDVMTELARRRVVGDHDAEKAFPAMLDSLLGTEPHADGRPDGDAPTRSAPSRSTPNP